MNHTPQQGDRILINNVPADYHFKDLYLTEGIYMGVVSHVYEPKESVCFTTCYTPYLDKGNFSASGCGNSVPVEKLKFLHRAPVDFWRFKNGEMRAHNGETYQLERNVFECEFSDINR